MGAEQGSTHMGLLGWGADWHGDSVWGSFRVLRARLCPPTDELINHAAAWMYRGVSGDSPPPPTSKKGPRRLLHTGLLCWVATR